MTFFAFGYNYESAPAEVRDQFALDEQSIRKLYRATALSTACELMVLSTCNRTEVYLFGSEADVVAVKAAIGVLCGHPWQQARAFEHRDEDAVRHVLQVTCGLKSLVLGDAQILSQVKAAYTLAVDEERVGTVLHRLLHTAFRTAKRVLNETGLSSGIVSISSAAVAMASAHLQRYGLPGLSGRRVLVLGAGQMGRLALHAIRKQGVAWCGVANRTAERASALAAAVGADMVPWAQRNAILAEADVIIVATGAPSPVLSPADLPARPEGAHPALVIDIAMPRNVDPTVDAVDGYGLLDLDALKQWVGRVEESRRTEVPAAEALCDESLAEFVAWMFHQQALQPGIQAIRDTFEQIRLSEIERHHHRFHGADREQLDLITRSILQKVLAVPIVRLKSVDPSSMDFVRGVQLLQSLFSRAGCDDETRALPESTSQDLAQWLEGELPPAASDTAPGERHDAEAPAEARACPVASTASASLRH